MDGSPADKKKWGRRYAAVLANLALQILLFYLFTRAFR
jgi:hypothetical protein